MLQFLNGIQILDQKVLYLYHFYSYYLEASNIGPSVWYSNTLYNLRMVFECQVFRLLLYLNGYCIVFVWSQYDGGNFEQRTIGYGCCQNQETKLKIVGESNTSIQLTRS